MNIYDDGTTGKIIEGDSVDDLRMKLKNEAVSLGKKIDRQMISRDRSVVEETKLITGRLEQLERKLNAIIVHLGIETPGEILVVDHEKARDR